VKEKQLQENPCSDKQQALETLELIALGSGDICTYLLALVTFFKYYRGFSKLLFFQIPSNSVRQGRKLKIAHVERPRTESRYRSHPTSDNTR
jgi:hypothetical protein